MHRVPSNAAREVAATLEKEHRLSKQEAGEGVRDRESGKHEKSVGGDSLQHIDLSALISATEFQFVTAMNPGKRARVVKGVLIGVAGSRDGIAHRGVAIDLNKRGTDGCLKAG